MLPLKDCRGYRSRYINALNRAVRALTPIAGRGIRLRQSAQGVVIEATAKGGAKASPFRHRWQVTAISEVQGTGTVWTLHVAPGSVWERDEEGALKEAEIAPETPVQADADAGGWKITPAASGTLYVAEDKDGAKTLRFGNADDEEDTVLVRIAEIALTTGDPPAASVLQRQIGDFVLAAPGQEETPVAWRVALRPKSVSSGTIEQWQIFAPTWTVGRETLLPEGMAEDWNDLNIHSGDLYAVLTWTGTATTDDAGEVKTTWTPGKPIITNDLTSIPADEDPTPDDPSTSTIEGKEGHRSIIVKIGTFLTDDSADDSDTPAEGEEPEPIGFLQIHTGSIIEDLNTSTPANAAEEPIDNPAAWEVRAFEEEQEDGTKKKVWKIWSPIYTAGYENYYAFGTDGKKTKQGWNNLSGGAANGKYLYACFSFDGQVWNRTEDGTGIVTWQIRRGRMRFLLREVGEEGRPPTRETPGIREIAVKIGRFVNKDGESTWEQDHIGSIVAEFAENHSSSTSYSFYKQEPFPEQAILPTAFAITEDGKLEVTTRNVNIPISQTDNEDKILLDLPGGGASDTLGPIEWDASRNSYVQYLGKWTYNGSSWVFAKKMNGNVAYPPAAVYPVTAAQLLVRANRYGNPDAAGDNIAVIPFNLPFAAAAATNWLSRRESTVSNGVVYTPPETVDGSGSLDSKTFTITYWSDAGETNRQTNNLLGSIVEAANQTSTYEG